MGSKSSHVLVAPLNWGLGHATRCIPVIRELLQQGARVSIASDGGALQLLRKEFPDLQSFELPGYDVHYKGQNMAWTMFRQAGKMLKAVVTEHKATQKIIEEANVDAVISDNRFGCYGKGVRNVFITHQINVISPVKLLEKPLQTTNKTLIKRFQHVWVPDFPGKPSLSGKLSHGKGTKNVTYLGSLTRMKKLQVEKKYDVVVVLSGPEPLRTELERKIFEQSIHRTEEFLIVRGLTERWEYFHMKPNIEVVSFLTSHALNEAICSGDVLVSRSGYSTILDLWALEKPAILVPTPGQTEQEYLAKQFLKTGTFFSQSQEEFNLETALKKVREYPGIKRNDYTEVDLAEIIQSFLSELN